MNEPLEIQAGITANWSFDHEFADGNWSFVYAMRGPDVIDITAIAENGVVSVSELASITGAWSAGLYQWQLFASNGDDRQLISCGQLEILADFASLGAGHDARTHEEKMLSSIKAVLEGRILSDHERYSIDGRSLDRIPILELQKLKRFYTLKVRNQKRSAGEIKIRRVRSRFVNG